MKVYERNDFSKFEYPSDMKLILDYLNSHGKILVKEKTIENLYYRFSQSVYCAGWMGVSDFVLEEFENWLNELDI